MPMPVIRSASQPMTNGQSQLRLGGGSSQMLAMPAEYLLHERGE